MSDARELAEDFAEEKPKAGNTLKRLRNGQGEYLEASLSQVDLDASEVYGFDDFVNDQTGSGPTETTAQVIINYLTSQGVVEETEEGYVPTGDVMPEEFVAEVMALDYFGFVD